MTATRKGSSDSLPTTTKRTDCGAQQEIEGIPRDAFFYAPSTLTRADFARFFPGDHADSSPSEMPRDNASHEGDQ